MCFVNLGNALNRLKAEGPELASAIPKLKKAVGFRNVLAHAYEKVEPEIVWRIARTSLPELERTARALLLEFAPEQTRVTAQSDALLQQPGTVDSAHRVADDVLVLSCAVSERVDAAAPVHRATLPQDIEEVLRTSARAGDVPEAEVAELALGIALKRAETDLRVAAARATDAGEIFEVRARFDGTPDYPEQSDIDSYEAALADGMRRLKREPPVPTEVERRVARAVVATRGEKDRHALALAMAGALELGTAATADEIRKERTALLSELQEGPNTREAFEERSLLRRIYRSFTGSEVRELSQGTGAFLEGLRDDTARAQTVQAVQRLHQKSWSTEPSPWRARHDTLVRSYGAERGGGRERGRHRGRGVGIEQ